MEADRRFLLQGVFPTQESNLCLLHCQANSLPLSHLGSPKKSLTFLIILMRLSIKHFQVVLISQDLFLGKQPIYYLQINNIFTMKYFKINTTQSIYVFIADARKLEKFYLWNTKPKKKKLTTKKIKTSQTKMCPSSSFVGGNRNACLTRDFTGIN